MEDACSVFVGGLAPSVTNDILHAAFVPFGELLDAHVPIDPKTGAGKGYGFVLFEYQDDAAAAIDNMNDSVINGHVISVRFANKKNIQVPGRAIWHEKE